MKKQVTLAEIEFYLRKAARAVQLDWGIAEEAGKAARWLAAFNLPGAEMSLTHLQLLDGKNYREYIPDCNQPVWQAKAEALCPIIAGAALADRAAQMLDGKEFQLNSVASPLLLAATIGQAARYFQTVFTVSWAQVSVSCYENGLSIEGERDDLFLTDVDSVKCFNGEAGQPHQTPSTHSYSIDDDIWQCIDAMAFKTYAPATEESRAGAGAGLMDND